MYTIEDIVGELLKQPEINSISVNAPVKDGFLYMLGFNGSRDLWVTEIHISQVFFRVGLSKAVEWLLADLEWASAEEEKIAKETGR